MAEGMAVGPRELARRMYEAKEKLAGERRDAVRKMRDGRQGRQVLPDVRDAVGGGGDGEARGGPPESPGSRG